MSVIERTGNRLMLEKRRSSIEIVAGILEEARNGINKTRLVYRTNLNFAVVQKYIDYLVEKNLLRIEQRAGTVYVTTEKGLLFVNAFSQLLNIVGIERPVL